MLSTQNIKDYLLRLGLSEEICADLDGLNTLVRAQLTNIPFENIDVWATGA